MIWLVSIYLNMQTGARITMEQPVKTMEFCQTAITELKKEKLGKGITASHNCEEVKKI